jgi:hypothetical protein
MFFGLAVTEETKLGAVITVAVALLWLWLGGGVEGLEPEAEVTTTTVFVCWIGSISLHRWGDNDGVRFVRDKDYDQSRSIS